MRTSPRRGAASIVRERGDEVAEALDARGVVAAEEEVLDVAPLEREVDGVRRGAAVIDVLGDGRMSLVGVIEQVGRRTSTVLTLRNGALRISARVGASGAVGFVNTGAGPSVDGTIPIGYLPSGGGYRPGVAVLTTGFEAGIPPGVTIGVISEVERRGSLFSDRPFLSGKVAPAADFDTLRFVVIATNAAPGGAGR